MIRKLLAGLCAGLVCGSVLADGVAAIQASSYIDGKTLTTAEVAFAAKVVGNGAYYPITPPSKQSLASGVITIVTPDGVTRTITGGPFEKTTAWFGRDATDPSSFVMFTPGEDGAVRGMISAHNFDEGKTHHWSIMPMGPGSARHMLREEARGMLNKDNPPADTSRTVSQAVQALPTDAPTMKKRAVDAAGNWVINVGFVYSPQAIANIGDSIGQLNAYAIGSLNLVNAVMALSSAPVRYNFTLAFADHMDPYYDVAANPTHDWYRTLQYVSGQLAPNVTRDDGPSDVMVVVTNSATLNVTGDTTIGQALGILPIPELAWAIVPWDAGVETFTHELGHLLGLRHQYENGEHNDTSNSVEYDATQYPLQHGYTSGAWSTLVHHNDPGCYGGQGGCPWYPVSNCTYTYMAEPPAYPCQFDWGQENLLSNYNVIKTYGTYNSVSNPAANQRMGDHFHASAAEVLATTGGIVTYFRFKPMTSKVRATTINNGSKRH